MNNTKLIALFVMSLVVTPVIAEKPGWAGKGKPTAEQKEAHRAAMEAKGEDMGGEEFGLKEKKEKSTMPSGLEKQRAKKSEKMQNELGKGSDKGKESREENSKKWWKFWEE